MANPKIIEAKADVVKQIKETIENASTTVWFEYRGLTVAQTDELRKKLKETGSELKIFKNTLTKRALDQLNIDLDAYMEGPKAVVFGQDQIAPIKVLSDFAKEHKALELKVGIVDGNVADIHMLNELASIPSREGLLTMFASGLLEHVRNMAICLDLHAKNLEKN